MIYYPKIYGVCSGANKAIDYALKLRSENKNKNIYIYKEILHNPYVINDLKQKHIYCIDDINIVKKDDILILRAHGETLDTYEYLKTHNINYYDATCINVKKVQELVFEKYNQNYNIIIVGKKQHPEVIATNSRTNNTGIIIENESDYKQIDKNKKYYVVCQTTTSIDNLNNLLNYLNKNNIEYEYKNTICNNQKLIQNESLKLAESMDMMIVLGGKNSSNTKELYNVCNKVCKTYYFEDIKEFYNFIKKQKITSKMKIGFTGGASTPKKQVEECARLLEFYIYYTETYKQLNKEMIKFNNTIKDDSHYMIKDATNKLINMNSDGKMLRGTLITLGYMLHKDDIKYSLPLSVAYETFETSILIHDDIIDNASLRRNKKTIHTTYNEEFNEFTNVKDNTPSSLALCIGDLGFFLINKLILNKYKNDKNLINVLNYYNDIVINTIKGEIIDVYLPFKEKNDTNNILKEDDILKIYELKTAYYSIIGPFILGMILSSSSKKEIKEFESILLPLGLSFQIKDDILGIFSNKEILGKSVVSDIEEFKTTILYSYIKLNNQKEYKELLKYYGKTNLTNDEVNKVKEIIINTGSLEYAENMMNKLFNDVKERIINLNIKSNVKNILLGFVEYLYLREK